MATSVHNFDDPIEAHAKTLGVNVFRGDLEDVGLRLFETAKSQNSKISFGFLLTVLSLIGEFSIMRSIFLMLSNPDFVTNYISTPSPKDNPLKSLRPMPWQEFVMKVVHLKRKNMLLHIFITITNSSI